VDWLNVWAIATNEENAPGKSRSTPRHQRAGASFLPSLTLHEIFNGIDANEHHPVFLDSPRRHRQSCTRKNASISGDGGGCQRARLRCQLIHTRRRRRWTGSRHHSAASAQPADFVGIDANSTRRASGQQARGKSHGETTWRIDLRLRRCLVLQDSHHRLRKPRSARRESRSAAALDPCTAITSRSEAQSVTSI